MSDANETREIVESYFSHWTAHRVKEAHALLADDLQFWGPTASYSSAAAFLPALANFAGMTKSARITELIVDGDRAAMLYDCELPSPVGVIKIASFFRVAGGKIATYTTLFDATELQKLVARRLLRSDLD